METEMKIVVLDRSSVGEDVSVAPFEKYGEVVLYSNTVAAEAAERVKDADIIVVNKTPMNETTLSGASRVRLICEFATGFDNIDLDYCRSRGITVVNVRNYSTAVVAQHTFAMALYLLEKLRYYDDYVKNGVYASQSSFSHFGMTFGELDGKTWGIVGMGNIGRKVASIAQAFGCRVIFYSASGKSTCTDYEQVDFDTLLSESDILSIHAPLNEFTENLMNATAFRKMKSSSILLNLGRGPIVNEADLTQALNSGEIRAAGLDVLSAEPMAQDNPLFEVEDKSRLLITPHVAWAAIEARQRLMKIVAEHIKEYLGRA